MTIKAPDLREPFNRGSASLPSHRIPNQRAGMLIEFTPASGKANSHSSGLFGARLPCDISAARETSLMLPDLEAARVSRHPTSALLCDPGRRSFLPYLTFPLPIAAPSPTPTQGRSGQSSSWRASSLRDGSSSPAHLSLSQQHQGRYSLDRMAPLPSSWTGDRPPTLTLLLPTTHLLHLPSDPHPTTRPRL